VAYWTGRGRQRFIVVDEEEGRAFDAIARDSPGFSPDSRRIVYAAKRQAQALAVVDGREGKSYDTIGRTPAFSPDSLWITYSASQAGKWSVVVNTDEGPAYDVITEVRVTWDGRDRLHYLAQRGNDIFVVDEEVTDS
jgi:Tol biopolymer transport system component